MGQYYRPLIIRKDGETHTLNSYRFDNGLKLMEHSWIGNSFVNAVYALIHDCPCKVVWMGDYGDDMAEEFAEQAGGEVEFIRLFKTAWGNRNKSTLQPADFKGINLIDFVSLETKEGYLVNHDTKQYLVLHEYIKENSYQEGSSPEDIWCVNPLSLLTACGNGQGGGDYRGINQDDVGKWAFNTLEYSLQLPAGYEQVLFRFSEKREKEGEKA